jgi:uncharacterized protein (TIGR03435 family)
MAIHVKLSCWRCAGRVIFAVALGGLPAFAQAGAPAAASDTTYVPTMTFDVASVRQSKVDANVGVTMSGRFVPHTTMLRLINWRIESIVSYAYGIDEYQIVGAPQWPWPTVFVIEAKGDSEANAKMAALTADQQLAEQRHMFQAMLADRFKLQAHWQTKQGDIYNLVVAKGGPKLGASGTMPPSADELKIFDGKPLPPLRQKNDGGGYDFIGHDCPVEYLAGMLTSQFARPVIDKTGLTGKYDFILKYKRATNRDRPVDDPDPMPPLDEAIQDQLGLKLEPAKGPVKVLVIDHIEKPSAN